MLGGKKHKALAVLGFVIAVIVAALFLFFLPSLLLVMTPTSAEVDLVLVMLVAVLSGVLIAKLHGMGKF